MRKAGFLVENLKIHGVWKNSFLNAMLVEGWNGAALKLRPKLGSDIGLDLSPILRQTVGLHSVTATRKLGTGYHSLTSNCQRSFPSAC